MLPCKCLSEVQLVSHSIGKLAGSFTRQEMPLCPTARVPSLIVFRNRCFHFMNSFLQKILLCMSHNFARNGVSYLSFYSEERSRRFTNENIPQLQIVVFVIGGPGSDDDQQRRPDDYQCHPRLFKNHASFPGTSRIRTHFDFRADHFHYHLRFPSRASDFGSSYFREFQSRHR